MSKQAVSGDKGTGVIPFLMGHASRTGLSISKSSGSGEMRFSGWLTTEDVDHAGHVLKAEGAAPYMHLYKANPIYCYNHDRDYPIGKVLDPQLILTGDTKGIFLKDIELMDISINTEYLWKGIQEEVFSQQSVGLKPKAAPLLMSKVLIFNAWMPIEGSLVPAAMNPNAILTEKAYQSVIRQIEDMYEVPLSTELLLKAYKEGVELPTISKNFKMSVPAMVEHTDNLVDLLKDLGAVEIEGKVEAPTTSFGDYVVKTQGDPKPIGPDRRNAEALKKAIAADEASGTLPLGGVDSVNQIILDVQKTISAVSLLCGARGGARSIADENKQAALEKACKALRMFGLEPPVTKHGTPVDQAEYGSWTYSDLTWGPTETVVKYSSELNHAISEAGNLMKGCQNAVSEGLSKAMFFKSVHQYARIGGFLNGPEESARMLAALEAYVAAGPSESEVTDMSGISEYKDADPTLKKYLYAEYEVFVGVRDADDVTMVRALMAAIQSVRGSTKTLEERSEDFVSAFKTALQKKQESDEADKVESQTESGDETPLPEQNKSLDQQAKKLPRIF